MHIYLLSIKSKQLCVHQRRCEIWFINPSSESDWFLNKKRVSKWGEMIYFWLKYDFSWLSQCLFSFPSSRTSHGDRPTAELRAEDFAIWQQCAEQGIKCDCTYELNTSEQMPSGWVGLRVKMFPAALTSESKPFSISDKRPPTIEILQ